MKRIALLMAVNLAVIVTLGFIARLTGVDRMFPGGLGGILALSAIMGFGGALISLMLSKRIAKWTMNLELVAEGEHGARGKLHEIVKNQALRLEMAMPEVAIFEAPEPNAFATGASENSALVAVSTGLLDRMTWDEVEAVLGHEMGHVKNGDMVTMTLIQGVLNTFVFFFARVFGMMIDRALSGNREDNRPGMGYWVASMALEAVFGLGAALIVAWFSRKREFKADLAGADLTSKRQMAAALNALRENPSEALPGGLKAFGISGGMSSLFATHPPIEERIERLLQN